jgi:hypothetical protein
MARGPDNLITPIAPVPCGVERATIVSIDFGYEMKNEKSQTKASYGFWRGEKNKTLTYPLSRLRREEGLRLRLD